LDLHSIDESTRYRRFARGYVLQPTAPYLDHPWERNGSGEQSFLPRVTERQKFLKCMHASDRVAAKKAFNDFICT
jgi:hypothetical protein